MPPYAFRENHASDSFRTSLYAVSLWSNGLICYLPRALQIDQFFVLENDPSMPLQHPTCISWLWCPAQRKLSCQDVTSHGPRSPWQYVGSEVCPTQLSFLPVFPIQHPTCRGCGFCAGLVNPSSGTWNGRWDYWGRTAKIDFLLHGRCYLKLSRGMLEICVLFWYKYCRYPQGSMRSSL